MTIAGSPDDYADMLEAAQFLGIHPVSLRRLVRQGHGPPVVTMRASSGRPRALLFVRASLEQFKTTYDPTPGAKAWDAGRLL